MSGSRSAARRAAKKSSSTKRNPASAPVATAGKRPKAALAAEVAAVLARLESSGTRAYREGLSRYGIIAPKAFGVPMGAIQRIAKPLRGDHELALALWRTEWYEARLLTAFIDDPALVTPEQMDLWCRDFDNWAVCDTLCFHLFDKTPHAFRMVAKWGTRRAEFEKRAAFALLASLALHDKESPETPFRRTLPLIERGAADPRNFVKKGVSWALRGIGRRTPGLHAASVALAERLAASADAAPRWVGKDVLRELTHAKVTSKIEALRWAAR